MRQGVADGTWLALGAIGTLASAVLLPRRNRGTRAVEVFYHGTSAEAADAIIEAGPDLESPRLHGAGELGWGFYLTSDPRYASLYAAEAIPPRVPGEPYVRPRGLQILEVRVEDDQVARLRNLYARGIEPRGDLERLFAEIAWDSGTPWEYKTLHPDRRTREEAAKAIRRAFLDRGWKAIRMALAWDKPWLDEIAVFDTSIVRGIRPVSPELFERARAEGYQTALPWVP